MAHGILVREHLATTSEWYSTSGAPSSVERRRYGQFDSIAFKPPKQHSIDRKLKVQSTSTRRGGGGGGKGGEGLGGVGDGGGGEGGGSEGGGGDGGGGDGGGGLGGGGDGGGGEGGGGLGEGGEGGGGEGGGGEGGGGGGFGEGGGGEGDGGGGDGETHALHSRTSWTSLATDVISACCASNFAWNSTQRAKIASYFAWRAEISSEHPQVGVGDAVTLPSMQRAARHLSRKVPFILGYKVVICGAGEARSARQNIMDARVGQKSGLMSLRPACVVGGLVVWEVQVFGAQPSRRRC